MIPRMVGTPVFQIGRLKVETDEWSFRVGTRSGKASRTWYGGGKPGLNLLTPTYARKMRQVLVRARVDYAF